MSLKSKITGIIFSTIIILIGLFTYFFHENIYLYYRDTFLQERNDIIITSNNYFKSDGYSYLTLTDDFIAKDKQHIINILYTIINSGNNEFTFYCSDNYSTCIEDYEIIANDQALLSNINNFVHPFNSFKVLSSSYSNNGDIRILIEKKYSLNEMILLNDKVDEIIYNNLNSNMSDVKKIEVIHDYIINNSKYNGDTRLNKANNILLDHEGLCSAYTDAMALFLYKLGYDNYKVASEDHIWNLVKLNNEWYHLDLTFDDPVTSDGSNVLKRNMFLISKTKLQQLDKSRSHIFDETVYVEAK